MQPYIYKLQVSFKKSIISTDFRNFRWLSSGDLDFDVDHVFQGHF